MLTAPSRNVIFLETSALELMESLGRQLIRDYLSNLQVIFPTPLQVQSLQHQFISAFEAFLSRGGIHFAFLFFEVTETNSP